MAGEIPDLKNKARRVKNLALSTAINVLEKEGLSVLNAVKRTKSKSQRINTGILTLLFSRTPYLALNFSLAMKMKH